VVAVGFTIISAVCMFAAPTRLDFAGANVPVGLSRAGLDSWRPTMLTQSSATST